MKTSLVLACVAAAAVSVDAHGYMMVPKAQLASGDPTRYASEVRGSTILTVPAGGSFSSSPQINVDSFTKAFKASSFKTLRDLIEQKTPTGKTCGITPSGGAAQDLPNEVQWSSFVDSHVGPCEVWCDQNRVFQNDNCAGSYKSQPAKLPIDKAGCAGAKELRFYWLALHSQDWQIYVNCAPLKGTGSAAAGGSGNSNSGGGAAATPAVTPAASTARPATPASRAPATTTRPSAPATTRPSSGNNNNNSDTVGGDSDVDCDDDLPIAGDDDCDDDLPVAGDDDCDDDLPVAGDDDCDDDLPVAGDDCDEDLPVAGDDKDEYGGESDNIGFDALQRGPKYSPGKAKTN